MEIPAAGSHPADSGTGGGNRKRLRGIRGGCIQNHGGGCAAGRAERTHHHHIQRMEPIQHLQSRQQGEQRREKLRMHLLRSEQHHEGTSAGGQQLVERDRPVHQRGGGAGNAARGDGTVLRGGLRHDLVQNEHVLRDRGVHQKDPGGILPAPDTQRDGAADHHHAAVPD